MMKKSKKQETSKKFRKDDKVIAIAGNNKGQIGTILSVQGDKAIVQGLNVKKKHVKPSQQMQKGGVIEIEKPIPVSNLMICVDEKPVKLKMRVKDKEKELVYMDASGKEVSYRKVR